MARQARRRLQALTAAALLALAPAVLAHDGPALSEPWRWVSFGMDAGLPSERILDVLDTPSGVPWVQTTGGLAWFDGHAWVPAAPGGPQGSERLAAWGTDGVVAVIAGDVVIATPSVVERVPVTLDGLGLGAWAACEMPGEEVLVLAGERNVRGDRLVLLRPADGAARLMPGAPQGPYQLVRASDGTPFVASEDGVHRWAGDRWHPIFPKSPEGRAQVSAAVVAGDETLVSLVSPVSRRGTWSVRGETEPLRVAEVATSLCAGGGQVAGAFDSGIVRLREGGAWHDVHGSAHVLRGITALCLRADGETWVGTDQGLHLYRSASETWRTWRLPGWDLRNYVTAILRTRDGSTWLATDGGVVVRHPGGTYETIDRIGDAPLTQVTALGEDSEGNVWIGSGAGWSGAWRFDGRQWLHFGAERGLGAERVHAVKRLPDGRTIFLCLPASPDPVEAAGPAVFELRPGPAFAPLGAESGLDVVRAYDVAQAPDGTTWFGTSSGAVRVRGTEHRRFDRNDGLPFGRIFCLAVARDGTAWMGARSGGLAAIRPDGRIETYVSADGLVDDEVWGLAVDDADRLWIATRRGVGALVDGSFTAFRGDSGLPVTRAWPLLADRDVVLVGTIGGGLARLDVAALEERPPRVRLAAPIVERDAALVRWSALGWWGSPPSADVPTRLRVDDGAWSAWSSQREAMLPDLAAGDHRVRIEARGLLAGSATSSAEAQFRVPLPPWRQATVLSLMTGIVLAGVTAAVLLSVRSRREQRRLRESEERYRQLVENASEIVFALDAAGRIAWTNRAGADVTARPPGELEGRDALALLAPESRDVARAAMERVRRTGEVVTYEVAALAPDGSTRIVEVSLGSGLGGGWHGIGRDVTDRKLREEEKQREQRLHSLGQLASGMAHDINNALAGVVGHLGLALLEIPEESATHGRLQQVEREALRCAELARQMLDYAGRGRFLLEPVDVGEVARHAATLSQAWLPRGTSVSVDVEDGLPRVQGDATQLARVVDNLVRNASEASSGEGHVRISVRHAPQGAAAVRGSWAAVPPAGPAVLVVVRDDGEGMSDETRSRAFDPFFSTRKEGRGLGLAATLGIVRAHGGAIAVETAPGRGATFTVVLPAAAPAAAAT